MQMSRGGVVSPSAARFPPPLCYESNQPEVSGHDLSKSALLSGNACLKGECEFGERSVVEEHAVAENIAADQCLYALNCEISSDDWDRVYDQRYLIRAAAGNQEANVVLFG
jgi:hypothetical protein